MAALNYATAYSRELDQVYPYVLNFGALYATPNNGRYKWLNSKTIEIPTLTVGGRVASDRDTIVTATRNYDNTWQSKTLENQRKWDTLVHPMDIDQTNMVTSINNITKTYNEEQKFPEMDCYTISKIHSDWTTAGGTVITTVLTADNVLTIFDELMQAMDEDRVTPNGRILYVTPAIKTLLKIATGITRELDVKTRSGEINRAVSMLDLVDIVMVPPILMKTSYNFTKGWVVGAGAKQIHMVLIHPNAVITPVSYEFAQLDPPSAMTNGKYVYFEESFEDVFILNNKKSAIKFVQEA